MSSYIVESGFIETELTGISKRHLSHRLPSLRQLGEAGLSHVVSIWSEPKKNWLWSAPNYDIDSNSESTRLSARRMSQCTQHFHGALGTACLLALVYDMNKRWQFKPRTRSFVWTLKCSYNTEPHQFSWDMNSCWSTRNDPSLTRKRPIRSPTLARRVDA